MSNYIDSFANQLLGSEEYCSHLAHFLKDELNGAYAILRGIKPSLPEGLVVRSVRNYDAVNIPLSEFPLLKVYRTSDVFFPGTTKCRTSGAITYSLSYPQLDALPDLLYWVSKILNYSLLKYSRTHKAAVPSNNITPYRTDYLLTVNEQQQVAYPFLRMGFEFLDTNDPCTSLLPYIQ